MYKSTAILGLVTTLSLLASPALAQVQVPFEGTLRDIDGELLTGPVKLTLSLHSGPDTPVGDARHQEEQVVEVNNGVLRFYIGRGAPLAPEVFIGEGAATHLGIAIEGGPELQPRFAIGAVPFAVHALSLSDGSKGPPGDSVVTTTLPSGNERCPTGGTEFRVGQSGPVSVICNGSVGPLGETGPAGTSVTIQELEPGHMVCRFGGAAFDDGTTVTYACSGAPGADAVSPTVTAAPVTQCPNGGIAVTDATGAVTPVCNGAPGADGANGVSPSITVATPAQCPTGGIAVTPATGPVRLVCNGAVGARGQAGTNGTNGANGISPTVTPANVAQCATGGVVVTDASGTVTPVCSGPAGAAGTNGTSPSVAVANTTQCPNGGVVVTDATGTVLPVCNGAAGATGTSGTNGVSPTVRVATVAECANGGITVTDATGAVNPLCNGTPGATGPAGTAPTVTLATTTQCAAGGIAITDAAGTVTPVCNGTDGAAGRAGVDGTSPTVALATPAQCASGGIAVTDATGTVTPVCNGTAGTDGASPTVVAATTAQCPTGGIAVTAPSGTVTTVCNGAAGADGADGAAGADGRDGVSPTVGTAPGVQCPTGGIIVTDASGTTTALCNGAPGADGVSPTVAIASPTECPNGGVVVTDASGTARNICNGADGAAGADGEAGADGQSVTVTSLSPGHPTCSAGGAQLRVGTGTPVFVCNGASGAGPGSRVQGSCVSSSCRQCNEVGTPGSLTVPLANGTWTPSCASGTNFLRVSVGSSTSNRIVDCEVAGFTDFEWVTPTLSTPTGTIGVRQGGCSSGSYSVSGDIRAGSSSNGFGYFEATLLDSNSRFGLVTPDTPLQIPWETSGRFRLPSGQSQTYTFTLSQSGRIPAGFAPLWPSGTFPAGQLPPCGGCSCYFGDYTISHEAVMECRIINVP